MGDKQGHPFRGNQYTSSQLGSRFTDYHEASAVARLKAREMKMDVAVRAQTEFGKKGFNVSLASRNDSDYARAEIVHPGDPFSDKDLAALDRLTSAANARSEKTAATKAEREQRIAAFHLERGTLDFSKEEAKASKMTDDQLAFARKDAFKAAEAMGRENPKQGFYMDQVSVYAKEQQKRAAAPNLEHLARENAKPAKISDVPEGGKGVYDSEGRDMDRYLKRGDADKAVVRVPPLAPRVADDGLTNAQGTKSVRHTADPVDKAYRAWRRAADAEGPRVSHPTDEKKRQDRIVRLKEKYERAAQDKAAAKRLYGRS